MTEAKNAATRRPVQALVGRRDCHTCGRRRYVDRIVRCRVQAAMCRHPERCPEWMPNAGAVPRRGSDVGTSPLLAVSGSGDKPC